MATLVVALGLTGCGGNGEPYGRDDFIDAVAKAVTDQESVRIRLNSGRQSMDLRLRLDEGDDFAMAGTVETTETFEFVVVDGRAYGRFSGEDVYRVVSEAESASLLAGVGELTPERMTRDLRATLESVEYVGPETVDGVELFRYDATASRALNVRQLGEELADQVRVTYRIWIDADDLIHKMTLVGLPVQSIVRMSEWGEDLDIEAPLSSRVE